MDPLTTKEKIAVFVQVVLIAIILFAVAQRPDRNDPYRTYSESEVTR